MREIAVFGGSAHPALTAEICAFLSVPQQPVRLTRFANDCLAVQLQANCRERDVFIIQPLVPPVQENLVELLLMADAARGASAARVTAVLSHYAYARSDKKDEPRISIGGRLVADLLVTAGVNRVLTLTLHSPQVHGFFSVPVDHLHALRELAAHFRGRDLSRAVVVSPDLGYAKSAAAFARRLGVPVAAGAKQRISDLKVIISAIIGDVAGRDVIILDDEIARGTTVFELLTLLREQDVRSVAVACTHGLFADGALDKLAACDVTEIVCTNSAPVPADHPKLHVLSVAPALAGAINRIHDGESVSALFGNWPPGTPPADSLATPDGGPRTNSSPRTGQRPRSIAVQSSSSSIGYQPSPGVTSASRALAYCRSRARQSSRCCLYLASGSRCRPAVPVDSTTAPRSAGPRLHPPRPRTASPCSAKTWSAADVAERLSRAARATSAPRASIIPSSTWKTTAC